MKLVNFTNLSIAALATATLANALTKGELYNECQLEVAKHDNKISEKCKKLLLANNEGNNLHIRATEDDDDRGSNFVYYNPDDEDAEEDDRGSNFVYYNPDDDDVWEDGDWENEDWGNGAEEDIVEDTRGRCGPEYGYCEAYECCSQYGWCGTTDDHCGKGCQSEFGDCYGGSAENEVPVSTVKGRCGPDYGACAGSNECCSKYGWCGVTETHCGTGCQSEFGVCNKTSATNSKKVPTSTVKGRCGAEYGACADSSKCCSKYGYCGDTEGHCSTGCQSKYGICW